MIDIQPEEAIKSLLGRKPWGVALGIGSTLTMEFGNEDPRQSSVSIHGEWHLWLYQCSWRIETGTEIVVACEDEIDRIKDIIKRFHWSPITSVELKRPSLDLEIGLADNVTLRTFSVNSNENVESDQWIFFTPELISVSARGGKLVAEEYPAGTPRQAGKK